jgi:hypothetical protein
MHKFRILKASNINIKWLEIEEGNINIESGIRFIYSLQDYDLNVLERKTFYINGTDFAEIGLSGKDTRIAIIELLLTTLDAILVKE